MTNKPDDAVEAARKIVKQLIEGHWLKVQNGYIHEIDNSSYGVLEATLADDYVLPIIRRVCKVDLPKLPKEWKGPFEVEVQDRMGGLVYFILGSDGKIFGGVGWREEQAKSLVKILNAAWDAQQEGCE